MKVKYIAITSSLFILACRLRTQQHPPGMQLRSHPPRNSSNVILALFNYFEVRSLE